MSINVDNYVLSKCLGKGSYGEVFLSTKKGSTELYATKRIDKKKMATMKKYLINEISILKRLNHKNIVRIEDVKQTKGHYYIMMEYCNGGGLMACLKNYIKIYHTPFSEEIVQHLMRQIVDAIKYMHKRRIIHRDLKLDNILVNFNNENDKKKLNMLKATVKIIDFGFAIYLDSNGLAFSALGSPMNMDPLILNELNKNSGALKGYDDKADIWSLGTLCYEMLRGKAPFYSTTVPGLVKNVEKGKYSLPLNISKEVVSFLNGMIQYDPKKRLSASELSRHHFLVKNVKDFTPINLSNVINKIGGEGIIVDIKKNSTIWEEFNEEDKKVLNSINANMLKPLDGTEELVSNVDFNNDKNFFVNVNPFDFDNLPIKTEENIKNVNTVNMVPNQGNVNNNLQRAKTFNVNNQNQQIYQTVNPAINNYGYGILTGDQIYDQKNNYTNDINIGGGKNIINDKVNYQNFNEIYNYNPTTNNMYNYNQSVNVNNYQKQNINNQNINNAQKQNMNNNYQKQNINHKQNVNKAQKQNINQNINNNLQKQNINQNINNVQKQNIENNVITSVNPVPSRVMIPGADPDSYSFSSGIYPAKKESAKGRNMNMPSVHNSLPIDYNKNNMNVNYYGNY